MNHMDGLVSNPHRRTWTRQNDDTIPGALAHAARAWPERLCIDYESKCFTYADFKAEVDSFAAGLDQCGVAPGDTVCVMIENKLLGVMLWFAVLSLGAVYVPLNTALKGEALRHQLTDSGSRFIVTQKEALQRIMDVLDPAADALVISDGLDEFRPDARLRDIGILKGRPERAPQRSAAPRDLAMILYTSGTTGPAKGCMVSHSYACYIGRAMVRQLAIESSDVVWSALPLFHVYGTCGVVLPAIFVGAKVALIPRFSVSNFWAEIERTGATIGSVVGSMGPLIANAPPSDAERRCFGRLRIVTGIPFSKEDCALWRERFGVGWVGNLGYGLTEAGRVAILDTKDEAALGSAGTPIDFDVRIFDDQDEECPAGQVGEIVLRPHRPGIMFDGYWRRPELTLATTRDLWFRTGDLGVFDTHGNLHFFDRKKDYMRRAGENISSYEVESVFLRHPAVVDVAAYGVPSELADEEVMLSVVLAPDGKITAQELCAWAADKMPYYCVPRYIEFRPDFPRTSTGKILKHELRAQALERSVWDRHGSDLALSKR
ncbi:ATP-dependent acyl-CoA ligase [Aliidongia dinghuensis]|uniref:ATP-dependent acyl-CoA ligase n=1 Tax=Aliidongia dinghuensis TaxID=1867774 RepID=A0A8J2Z273_9PROT|nr:AMP-binding protein [Aliidongia dinghuensis]GGF50413.1 ATP-dependent acyl-CoA ligase [Aliidongia dinghuensis]